jgi:hypothetical protein
MSSSTRPAPASTAPARWPAPNYPTWTCRCAGRSRSRAACSGPAGRAGQDRPQIDRRRPLPARCRPEGAGRRAGRRGGERRQPGGRRCQHRVARAADLRRRHRAEAGGNIVAHRDENGAFATRRALARRGRAGAKGLRAGAGFLRIRDGEKPLDASAIHPESYAWRAGCSSWRGFTMARRGPNARPPRRAAPQRPSPTLAVNLSGRADAGRHLCPARAPRARPARPTCLPPILRSDVLSLDDLAPGMKLQGTVRNVVDFGAFVDIGVKQDGLLHRSQGRGSTSAT